jgi:hypothetical protein
LYLFVIIIFTLTYITAMVMFKLFEITHLKSSDVLPRCPFCDECFQWFKILPYALGNCWPTRALSKF